MIASLIPKRYRFLGLDLYKSLDRLLYEGLTVPVLVLPLKLVVISVVIFGHRDAQELSPGISGPVHLSACELDTASAALACNWHA